MGQYMGNETVAMGEGESLEEAFRRIGATEVFCHCDQIVPRSGWQGRLRWGWYILRLPAGWTPAMVWLEEERPEPDPPEWASKSEHAMLAWKEFRDRCRARRIADGLGARNEIHVEHAETVQAATAREACHAWLRSRAAADFSAWSQLETRYRHGKLRPKSQVDRVKHHLARAEAKLHALEDLGSRKN